MAYCLSLFLLAGICAGSAEVLTRKTGQLKATPGKIRSARRIYFLPIMNTLKISGLLILIAFAVAMAQSPPPANNIKVSIATTDGFLGPPATRYKVGQQIPVTITMTNTTNDALYTCISSDVYQDLPKLTRDGKVVPYANSLSYETVNAKRNHVCQEENLPEPVLLKPNQPRVADWFLLVNDRTTEDADAWYDVLPAGKYELTIQRRLACCDGPMVDSNKISFEVVQ